MTAVGSDFFARLAQTFARAADVLGGADVRHLRVGGCLVELQLAGQAWSAPTLPAFAHLACVPEAAEQPGLRICLWDTASSGLPMPRPPWPESAYVKRCEIAGFNTENVRTAFNPLIGMLSMLDLSTGTALGWIRDARAIPGYEQATPLIAILHWAMRSRGLQIVHAGCVGSSEGGLLLAGAGGAGKSSTVLRCLESDLFYLGDDLCLLEPGPPRVHSLYNSGRVRFSDLDRCSLPAAWIENPEDRGREKALVFVHRQRPEKLLSSVPLKAIVLPQISRLPQTRCRASSPAAAFRALLEETLRILPGVDPWTTACIARAVRRVPCFNLQLGCDDRPPGPVLRELLESL